jgi:hypothetical protein
MSVRNKVIETEKTLPARRGFGWGLNGKWFGILFGLQYWGA